MSNLRVDGVRSKWFIVGDRDSYLLSNGQLKTWGPLLKSLGQEKANELVYFSSRELAEEFLSSYLKRESIMNDELAKWNFKMFTGGTYNNHWYAYKGLGQGNDNYLFNDGTACPFKDKINAFDSCVLASSEEEAKEAVKKYILSQNVTQETKVQSGMNFIKSNDERYSGVFEGRAFVVNPDHSNYRAIVECFQKKDYTDFWALCNPAKAVEKYIGTNVVVEGGVVVYRGEEVKNAVVDKIFEFMKDSLPVEPLVKFLENLLANPSMASRNELYDFLEHNGFPLTEDGCFLAYKGLRENYLDIHSGKFSNTIGSVIEMERHDVDDDRRVACSYGFHVGTYEYANGFQKGKLVMVKVNPRDVVSVPHDCSCQKCRVCKYEVIQDCEVQFDCPLVSQNESGVYKEYEPIDDNCCDECGRDYNSCSCETF